MVIGSSASSSRSEKAVEALLMMRRQPPKLTKTTAKKHRVSGEKKQPMGRALIACEECRRKKKRCTHNDHSSKYPNLIPIYKASKGGMLQFPKKK